jgi:hypothetical protein
MRLDNSSSQVPLGLKFFEIDNFLDMIACKEVFQFCDSATDMCGPWMGLDNVTTTSTELASPENRNKALR